MCESTVVMQKNNTKETIMEDVAKIDFTTSGVTLMDIIGQVRELENVRIVEANLVNHEIVLEEI